MSDSPLEGGERKLPIWDHDTALASVGGNADLMRELFETFLGSIGPHWEELRQLCRAKNWTELYDSAHRLHGSAAYCGVPAIKSAVKELETAAAAGDEKTVASSMGVLAHEIECLRQFAKDQDNRIP